MGQLSHCTDWAVPVVRLCLVPHVMLSASCSWPIQRWSLPSMLTLRRLDTFWQVMDCLERPGQATGNSHGSRLLDAYPGNNGIRNMFSEHGSCLCCVWNPS
jgi:hypothetical protein